MICRMSRRRMCTGSAGRVVLGPRVYRFRSVRTTSWIICGRLRRSSGWRCRVGRITSGICRSLRSIIAGEVGGVCHRVSGRVGRVDPEEGRGGKVVRVRAKAGNRGKADTLRVVGRVVMGGWLRLGELRSEMVVEIVRAGGGDPCVRRISGFTHRDGSRASR